LAVKHGVGTNQIVLK